MIEVRGLAHRYGAATALRLQGWRVAQGERWAVLGASGSGKTTLLHVIAGLVRPSEGEVEVSGQDLGKLQGPMLDRWRGATIGIVLQALHLVRHLPCDKTCASRSTWRACRRTIRASTTRSRP